MLACTGCGIPPVEQDPWVEVTSDHFQVLSNRSAESAEDLVRELELFRVAVLAWTGVTPLPISAKPRIYLFDDYPSYRPFESRLWTDGYYVAGLDGGDLVVYAGETDERTRETARHEIVHLVLRGSQDQRSPPWYSEGLAELLSTARREESVMIFGSPPAWVAPSMLTFTRVTVQELVAEYNLGEWYGPQRSSFYASAWGLTHMLRLGQGAGLPDRNDLLDRYLERVSTGADPIRAVVEVFGPRAVELDQELLSYLWQGDFPEARVELPASARDPGPTATRLLSIDEAAYWLGQLAGRLGIDYRDTALELLERGSEANPDNPRVLALLALTRRGSARHVETEAHFERSLALGPEDAVVRVLHARYLLWWSRQLAERARESDDPAAAKRQRDSVRLAMRQARDELERSIELDPRPAEAYYWLGIATLVDGRRVQSGVRALEKARNRAPWSAEISVALGRAYLLNDRPARARYVLNKVARWPDAHRSAAEARLLLEQIQRDSD